MSTFDQVALLFVILLINFVLSHHNRRLAKIEKRLNERKS